MKIYLIHGISTKPDYPMAETWGPFIIPHFEDPEVVEVRWDSTGTILGDVVNISLDDMKVRLAQVDRALRHVAPGDVIVAHSMGTIWLLQLLWADPKRFEHVHTLLFGSPCSHFGIRSLLRFRGFLGGLRGGFDPGKVRHFWNRDDRVCALSQWASHPSYTDPEPVAIADRKATEHPLEMYLGAPVPQEHFAKLGSSTRSIRQ